MRVVPVKSFGHFAEADLVTAGYAPDALGLSGGDEAQSAGAVVASGRELPYTCVPCGSHNLFARDLGIDQQDPFGALDAFLHFCEYEVDLGEVNGRTFVNYVALGLDCAPAPNSAARDDPRIPASLVSYSLTPRRGSSVLAWFGPAGRRTDSALFISNNRCRFKALEAAGRARLDGGVLGIGVLDMGARAGVAAGGHWQELCTSSFEIDGDGPLMADIDGLTVMLEPPLRFRSLPRALRVRIPLTA
ncbi:MAG TPA: diacylglycerol kinase family protein [Solirubrobacteraceae bacterium]